MTTTKILIIEDERQSRMALARAFKSGGYQICVADDAVAAGSTAGAEPLSRRGCANLLTEPIAGELLERPGRR
jgi:DNA-binding NtrC family response regulator